MPLRVTSAPVSGIRKNRKPATPRPRASPFAAHARRKPSAPSSSGISKISSEQDEYEQGPLPDLGPSRYIPETAPVTDVVEALQYIRNSIFEDLPRRAGMNSTRIAEVLNFRRSLPPLASVAHVHTLLEAPTKVEKEIMELVRAGRVRRLIVPGRGNDAAGLGDCLVLSEEWDRLVLDSPALEAPLKGEAIASIQSLRQQADPCQRNFSRCLVGSETHVQFPEPLSLRRSVWPWFGLDFSSLLLLSRKAHPA